MVTKSPNEESKGSSKKNKRGRPPSKPAIAEDPKQSKLVFGIARTTRARAAEQGASDSKSKQEIDKGIILADSE